MSAELKSLILCDLAQIRVGLLLVQSGWLTRMVSSYDLQVDVDDQFAGDINFLVRQTASPPSR